MTDEAKALGIRHAKITGKDMRDHWGPIVDRIADEISDPRDALIETQAREIERLREALGWYEKQANDCRKITREGDDARYALDRDGGERARAALAGDSHD